MRILIVQESDWLEKGPHQSHHLLERLAREGHEVRVIDTDILTKKNIKKLFSKRTIYKNAHKVFDNADITVIRPSYIKFPILNYVSQVYTHDVEIKRQIKEFKPDVIIGFSIINSSLAIRSAKKYGIPFVYYIIDELHMLVPQKYFQSIAKYVESDNMKNADIVISINEMLKEYTIRMGAKDKNTMVLPAGVDMERFISDDIKSVRERHGIKENDVVLFYIGWMYNFSGLKEVALGLAKSGRKNIKLLILGKGDLWDEIQAIKKEYGLDDRIITVDWRPYNEVPQYILASDICLLPAYKNEIMKNIVPIKMYEYMAASKPVISTRLPGILKEFGKDSGITYIDDPDEALAKAIQLVDSGVMLENGAKARKFVEKNSWIDITNNFENTLRGMVKKKLTPVSN